MVIDRRTALLGMAGVASLGLTRPACAQVQEAIAYSEARNGVSVLVMQGDQVVSESYANGGGDDRAWELASGTKSFCGVLAAALVQDNLLTLDEVCADTLPEWRDDPVKSRATIRTLLNLTSGIGTSSSGRPPTYGAALTEPVFAAAGAVFRYSPTPFQAFGEIVRRKLVAAGRTDDVLAFMRDRLLDPIGVNVGSWRTREGQPTLPSGCQLTARDWARFGRFVLDGGRVDGRALVDAEALAACFQPSALNPGYGLSWWLLRPGLVAPSPRSGVNGDLGRLGGLPDIRMAAGAGNQRLYLLPERDMVIVRQATGIMAAMLGRGADWSDADFLRPILA